tara:strand:- start:94 stop:771 length:678 start_codon:yes stop_codon:yes gene_type:complete
MDLSERNKKNIISAWKKRHKKDIDYINKTKNWFLPLKSRLCGFIAGDGNLLFDNGTCRHNTLRFYPDHPSLVRSYTKALLKAYNKKPRIKKERNHFSIILDSKPVVNDFLKLGNFGKLNWNIPNFVFKSNQTRIEWLRAFFDCEAHVHKKYIMVKSVNFDGLKQVQGLLDDFKIHSKIYSYEPKNPNHNTNYMLTIYRKDDKKRYLDHVGFNHTIKLKKLRNLLY